MRLRLLQTGVLLKVPSTYTWVLSSTLWQTVSHSSRQANSPNGTLHLLAQYRTVQPGEGDVPTYLTPRYACEGRLEDILNVLVQVCFGWALFESELAKQHQ